MTTILLYVITIVLSLVALFFLLRTLVVSLTMFYRVPFVPSGDLFKEAIKYLDIKDGDTVLDIGSGDGRVLLYASKKYPDASFVGIEKNLPLVIYSNILKLFSGRKNVHFKCKDALEYDISDFDAIYLYLLPEFADEIFLPDTGIKKGCRVVSFHYPLGKKFSKINNVVEYPVKYKGKQEYIFKWVNNGNTRR